MAKDLPDSVRTDVEAAAFRRLLEPAMRGAIIERVRLGRPDLRAPFPPRFEARLRGQTVADVGRRGKYLLARLSSGDTLVMHLGMTGEFRIDGLEATTWRGLGLEAVLPQIGALLACSALCGLLAVRLFRWQE